MTGELGAIHRRSGIGSGVSALGENDSRDLEVTVRIADGPRAVGFEKYITRSPAVN